MNCPSRSRSVTHVSPSLLRKLKPGAGRTFSGPQRWKITDMGFRPVSFQGSDPPRKAVNCSFVPALTKNFSQGFPALTPACPCIHSVALPGSLPLTPAQPLTHSETLLGLPELTPVCSCVGGMVFSRHPRADPGCWLTWIFPGASVTREGGRKGVDPNPAADPALEPAPDADTAALQAEQ